MAWSRTTRAVGMGAGAWLVAVTVAASPIVPDTFYEFETNDAGVALGCDTGNCDVVSGLDLAPAPPWTFVAPKYGSYIIAGDLFEAGDVLEAFDFGVSLGTTSPAALGFDCGSDLLLCATSLEMSQGLFVLDGGAHSITFAAAPGYPNPGGAHYFVVQDREVLVPEPATVLLLGAGLAGVMSRRARRSPARRRS